MKKTKKSNKKWGIGFRTPTVPKLEVPKTVKKKDTLSVVFFNQKTLNDIATMCLPKANRSEFQVHYRGIQITIKNNNGKRIVFTIPTVFFNMPQKVTSSSVNFNLNEIQKISDEVQEISGAYAKSYLQAFPTEFFKQRGYEIEFHEYEMGSIHRHPGDFGFSSIDLDNSAKEPGVIFRNKQAEDKIQTDSVMYIPNQIPKIVTTETRVVNVSPLEDGGIRGEYAQVPTVTIIYQSEADNFKWQSFFEDLEKKDEKSFIIKTSMLSEKVPELQEVFEVFLETLEEKNEVFEPMLIIDPNLIEEETSFAGFPNKRYNSPGRYGNTKSYDWEDEDEDEVDYYDYYNSYYYNEASLPTPSPKKADTTPTWRKKFRINLLEKKGINCSKSKIKATDEDKDIEKVINAMHHKKVTYGEAEQFLKHGGYPTVAFNKLRQKYKITAK